ncbi:MAG: SAM-dependent methyltransferase [Pseudomonadota bacterium]
MTTTSLGESFEPLCVWMHRQNAGAAGSYYREKDRLGAAGDFITAPEISQIFGELLGAAAVDIWGQLGQPASFVLAELGPGRGTLMADALRVAPPQFRQAMSLALVEINPHFRDLARAALAAYNPGFYPRVSALPNKGPLIVLANEFFDALAIDQWRYQVGVRGVSDQNGKTGWQRRLIGAKTGQLGWSAPGPWPYRFPAPPQDAAPPIEVSVPSLAAVSHLARRIVRQGGAMVIVDYQGAGRGGGDSLRAIRNHRLVRWQAVRDGDADLSAGVAFGALGWVATRRGAQVCGPVSQAQFLQNLGLFARLTRLIQGQSADTAAALTHGARRLVHGMGQTYQAMTIYAPARIVPAGYGVRPS